MDSIIKLFLRAKHWQLFVVGFVPVIIFYINTMLNVFGGAYMQNPEDVSFLFESYRYFGPVMVIVGIVNYGWIWAIGEGLHAKLPPYVTMNIRRFKWFIGIPFFYLMLISLIMSYSFWSIFPSFFGGDIQPNVTLIIVAAIVIVPLHLFSLFAIFYSLYFAAKTVKSVELQREVIFSDFIAEFFLIWFFPIGVWILQPKLNKLEEGTDVFHQKTL